MNRADQKQRPSGSTLVEFALVLPLLFILIVNVVNFGGFLFAWITLANAARAGAEYMTMGGSYVGAPIPPNVTEVTNLVTADVYSLLNKSSLIVRVCQRDPSNSTTASLWNDKATACPAGFSNPPADTRPEASVYVTGWVDVQYTYQPFIPVGFKFPGLNLYTTLPPTTIHRQAVMRLD